ncbi:TonB-dependent receptor [Pseudoalteromonas luteoviolacea]|nr:TonB-dependent receptor [Pseudoalteromonas luteoviolacea]
MVSLFQTRFKLSLISVAISALCPWAVASEQNIEQISVWSTQVKSSAPYLQGQEIADKQADHISDLLRTIPGVDVGGAHSLNQRITIRSLDDKDLKVTIDGASQNAYMYHHMGNLQIHADILKSVEIHTGTNSVVNGGLGGAVRFTTKQAKDLLQQGEQFGARLSAATGDNSGQQFSFTGFGQLTGELDFLIYFNDVNKDNFKVGGDQILDENGKVEPDTDGTVRGLAGDVKDTLIKFGWDINQQQRLSIGYEQYEDSGDYSYRPDMGMSTDVTIATGTHTPLTWPTKFTRDTLTLSYELNFGHASTLTANLFDNVSELYRDESGWGLSGNPRYNRFIGQVNGEAQNSGFNLLAQSVFDTSLLNQETHTVTYGIDHIKHQTKYHFSPTQGQALSAQEEAKSTAFFIQNRIELTSELAVVPGVRFEQADVKSAVLDNNFNHTTFALAGLYQLTPDLLIKMSTTELFKAPELSEVFTGAGLGAKPNPNLKAETGINTEISIAYQYSADSGRYNLGATYFETRIEDYIHDYVPYPNGGPRDTYKQNIGHLAIDGYEAYMSFDAGQLEMTLNYSSSSSELDAFDTYEALYDGARIDREQGDTLAFNLHYEMLNFPLHFNWEVHKVKSLSAGLDLDGRARLDNSKPGFTVHNIVAVWQPKLVSGLELRIGVDNLFDKYYASQSSRTGLGNHPVFGELFLLDYEPGRNIKVSVSYHF